MNKNPIGLTDPGSKTEIQEKASGRPTEIAAINPLLMRVGKVLSHPGRSPYFHPSLWPLAVPLPTLGTEAEDGQVTGQGLLQSG